ncbi:erythroblast NAD(P)(+)--arginine ADP-ribosyltransferase-like [Melospiza melodia melodia]|uniref:erythroblast NAD(P)(+)--arginine ADP-ribosyltransferase-like n=1 Tax=Melospiza melodia melodia TaxID=1914991 RepID=UPI002FD1F789
MAPPATTLTLLAMAMATMAVDVIPLDMAPDSFDDKYQGCDTKMIAELPALNNSEFQQNPLFAQALLNATAKWRGQKSPVSSLSSPAQAIALMAYTMNELYREFNEAVRTAGRSSQEYRDNFHFKMLHFLLTQALVMLRQAQNGQCHNVYLGVCKYRFKAKPSDMVRFGQFSSASQNEKTAQHFGSAMVLQVYAFHGAAIWNFSKYPNEKEVLIPPYETFQVIKVSQEGEKARIQLRSNGNFSNYTCEWLQGGSIPRAPSHLGGLLLATTTLAVLWGQALSAECGWESPQGHLPPWRTPPGHYSPGTGHWDLLSHKTTTASKVTVVTVASMATMITIITVASSITKNTRTPRETRPPRL